MPELRIVDQALWNAVRQRQANCALGTSGDPTQVPLNETHRRKFVLNGLLQCGVCGAGYTVMAKDRYGCATCTSRPARAAMAARSPALTLERRVLDALWDKKMEPDVMAEFIVAYNEEVAAAVRAAAAREHIGRSG